MNMLDWKQISLKNIAEVSVYTVEVHKVQSQRWRAGGDADATCPVFLLISKLYSDAPSALAAQQSHQQELTRQET